MTLIYSYVEQKHLQNNSVNTTETEYSDDTTQDSTDYIEDEVFYQNSPRNPNPEEAVKEELLFIYQEKYLKAKIFKNNYTHHKSIDVEEINETSQNEDSHEVNQYQEDNYLNDNGQFLSQESLYENFNCCNMAIDQNLPYYETYQSFDNDQSQESYYPDHNYYQDLNSQMGNFYNMPVYQGIPVSVTYQFILPMPYYIPPLQIYPMNYQIPFNSYYNCYDQNTEYCGTDQNYEVPLNQYQNHQSGIHNLDSEPQELKQLSTDTNWNLDAKEFFPSNKTLSNSIEATNSKGVEESNESQTNHVDQVLTC